MEAQSNPLGSVHAIDTSIKQDLVMNDGTSEGEGDGFSESLTVGGGVIELSTPSERRRLQ
jgi:hypothetical protein